MEDLSEILAKLAELCKYLSELLEKIDYIAIKRTKK